MMMMMRIFRPPMGRFCLCLWLLFMMAVLTMLMRVIEWDNDVVVRAIPALAWLWPLTSYHLLLLLLLLCGRVLILVILILIRVGVQVLVLVLVYFGILPRLDVGVFPMSCRFRSGSTSTAGWIWVLPLPLSLSLSIAIVVVIKEILIRTPYEVLIRFCCGFSLVIIYRVVIIIIVALPFSPLAFLRKLCSEPVGPYVDSAGEIVRVDVAVEGEGVVSFISLLFLNKFTR
jgi:hypothetical protein